MWYNVNSFKEQYKINGGKIMKLVWEDSEMGWICSDCGARYSTEEVARMFNYNDQIPENFVESYCMDCGGLFSGIEIE